MLHSVVLTGGVCHLQYTLSDSADLPAETFCLTPWQELATWMISWRHMQARRHPDCCRECAKFLLGEENMPLSISFHILPRSLLPSIYDSVRGHGANGPD